MVQAHRDGAFSVASYFLEQLRSLECFVFVCLILWSDCHTHIGPFWKDSYDGKQIVNTGAFSFQAFFFRDSTAPCLALKVARIKVVNGQFLVKGGPYSSKCRMCKRMKTDTLEDSQFSPCLLPLPLFLSWLSSTSPAL